MNNIIPDVEVKLDRVLRQLRNANRRIQSGKDINDITSNELVDAESTVRSMLWAVQEAK